MVLCIAGCLCYACGCSHKKDQPLLKSARNISMSDLFSGGDGFAGPESVRAGTGGPVAMRPTRQSALV